MGDTLPPFTINMHETYQPILGGFLVHCAGLPV